MECGSLQPLFLNFIFLPSIISFNCKTNLRVIFYKNKSYYVTSKSSAFPPCSEYKPNYTQCLNVQQMMSPIASYCIPHYAPLPLLWSSSLPTPHSQHCLNMSGTLYPQDFCTCYSLCLKCSSLRYMHDSLTFFRSLFKNPSQWGLLCSLYFYFFLNAKKFITAPLLLILWK